MGEGIVTTIGSAKTHKDVLENPDLISQTVLRKGLDSGTAFEILSIDIADVDIGKNIGAALQTDQAEADKKIAQAKAERTQSDGYRFRTRNESESRRDASGFGFCRSIGAKGNSRCIPTREFGRLWIFID